MGKLELKLKKRNKKRVISTIIIMIIGIAFIIPGILVCTRNPEDSSIFFNKFTTEYEYSKTDVKYLMGPFASETKNGYTIKEFYLAEGKDEKCFIIATKKNPEIPIYGEDVEDEDLKTLELTRVYGCAEPIDTELQDFFLEAFNEGLEETEKLDHTDCKEWLGKYYIDTTERPQSAGVGMCMFGGMFLLIALSGVFSDKKIKKKQEDTISELENWDEIKADYENGPIIEYKKLDLDLGNKYLYNFFNGLVEFTILAYDDISKVYASNIKDGKMTQCTFIVIETKDNKKYYIGAKLYNQRIPEFEEAIKMIKEKITI